MKKKILTFLKTTQKATAALAGAVGVLSAATFLPDPYGHYVAIAGVFLTWALTYFFPYVEKTVESFPVGEADWPELDLRAWEKEINEQAVQGDVLPPRETPAYGAVRTDTSEMPAIRPLVEDTQGIEVIEGPDAREGLTVDDIIYRLTNDGTLDKDLWTP